MENSEERAAAGASGLAGVGMSPNVAAWLLVVAFVGLVLSVAVPAMTGVNGDLAAALLFMVGLAAALLGTGLAIAAAASKGKAVLGGLVLVAGTVLLYGLVPSLAALGVVLLGVALEISSLPDPDLSESDEG